MPREGISVEIRGIAELIAGTGQLATNIERGAGVEFLGVADAAARATRGRLHQDTGATAESVLAQREGTGASVSMGEGVPYAVYEEYGGRGWPHSPQGNFLYPSVADAEPVLIAAGERLAEREIGAMHWPSP